jgi:hypothetical protein
LLWLGTVSSRPLSTMRRSVSRTVLLKDAATL